MTRVAIFIDGGYFRAYLRQIGEPKIDFLKLSQKLSKPDDLFRTYYYNCMPYQSNPPTQTERRMYADADRFIFFTRDPVRRGGVVYSNS
jgi:hypothetical protein